MEAARIENVRRSIPNQKFEHYRYQDPHDGTALRKISKSIPKLTSVRRTRSTAAADWRQKVGGQKTIRCVLSDHRKAEFHKIAATSRTRGAKSAHRHMCSAQSFAQIPRFPKMEACLPAWTKTAACAAHAVSCDSVWLTLAHSLKLRRCTCCTR